MLRYSLGRRIGLGLAGLLLGFAPCGASAADYDYTARTASNARQQGTVVAGGITWRCKGNECRTSASWRKPDTGSCNALAQIVGTITAYGNDRGRALDSKELAACNKGIAQQPTSAVELPDSTSTPTPDVTDDRRKPVLTSTGEIEATVESVCPSGVADCDGDGYDSIAFGGYDCDDHDRRRFPGNIEVCDSEDLDEDCDGNTFGIRDADGDGFIDMRCCNSAPGEGINCGRDCNDALSIVHPNAPEACDLLDNNCDGSVDEGSSIRQWPDLDGDLFGDRTRTFSRVCPGTSGYSPLNTDCDDTNPAIAPGAMLCAGSGTTILVCINGQYDRRSCPSGTICVPQPNGTGACQEM